MQASSSLLVLPSTGQGFDMLWAIFKLLVTRSRILACQRLERHSYLGFECPRSRCCDLEERVFGIPDRLHSNMMRNGLKDALSEGPKALLTVCTGTCSISSDPLPAPGSIDKVCMILQKLRMCTDSPNYPQCLLIVEESGTSRVAPHEGCLCAPPVALRAVAMRVPRLSTNEPCMCCWRSLPF